MPKELVYLSTGALEVREYQEPALAMGQVRVRSEARWTSTTGSLPTNRRACWSTRACFNIRRPAEARPCRPA